MRLRDMFILTGGTRVILAITLSVSLIAIVFAYFYYRSVNRSEDPRIVKAREYLDTYDKKSAIPGNTDAFLYLDSALTLFRSFPDYASSFETGVIYNNKCSFLMLPALYDTLINDDQKRRLLGLSMSYCDTGIMIYSKWISEWGSLAEESVRYEMKKFMDINDPVFKGYDYERILDRRVKNIILARKETPRRLSVSYTNKGTIYRHLGLADSAAYYLQKALQLWKENTVAESNLSVLMGGEPVRPNLLRSLFPPDRKN